MDQAPPPYEAKDYPPPQQPGYQPPQPGYQPPQPGYQPPQPGYPPQQPGYQPPQPGYPPQQPGYPPSTGYGATTYPPSYNTASTTTIVTSQPTSIAVPVVFNEFPVAMTCPSCKHQIVTTVMYEPGSLAYLLFFLMCIFGGQPHDRESYHFWHKLFWICCCIPFCVDSCKDAIHSCPNCRAQLGVCRRM